MAHKTLTISEEAYNALARIKGRDESFTKAILRLTNKKAAGNLLDYVRSFSPDEELASAVPSSREPLVCLDTTFLVDLVRARPEAEKRLLHFLENDERITTTPVNAAELYDGAFSTKSRRTEAERVRGLLEHLELLELSLSVCEKYGRLTNELKAKGSPIGDLDTLVASTALVHRQIPLTRDKAHFEKVPGLVVESW